MAQISSFDAFPDPGLHLLPSSVFSKAISASGAQKSAAAQTSAYAGTDQTEASPIQSQLTRLSSVLSGLQQTATTSRAQYVDAFNQVKAGTYNVNSNDVSRSIVNDLLIK